MTPQETRILNLPLRFSKYAIVSMPQTTWYWLDDLVQKKYPGGYKALARAFKTADSVQSLSRTLKAKAQEHCDAEMMRLYNLANDNRPPEGYTRLPERFFSLDNGRPQAASHMPTVYRLFHFLAHPTLLTTVWERRNYHLKADQD